MKRTLITLYLCCAATFLNAAETLKFSGSDAALVGVYVVELASGKELAADNADKVFIPASVTKCVTAASAVKLLKSGSTFTTDVVMTGNLSRGILHGDIIIKGSGDPTIDSRHITSAKSFVDEVVEAIASQAIDSIAGDVMVDISALPEIGVSPYWLLEDIAWEYGAGLYGFNYRDNSFAMRVNAEKVLSMSPEIPDLDVKIDLRRGSSGDVMAMRGEDSYCLTLSGEIASGSDYASRYSMPFPDMVFRNAVISALQKRGIGCYGEFAEVENLSTKAILKHTSPTRDEILRPMMFKSINLFAEGMLRALAQNESDKTTASALAIEKDLLKSMGLDMSYMKISDGSGLAVTNRISPRFLGSLLTKMAQSSDAATYVGLFPAVGKEGSVRSLLADSRLAGKLVLKSGSMSGVLCYAGYKVDSAGRPTHVVVIMANNFTCRVADVRTAAGKWLLSIF